MAVAIKRTSAHAQQQEAIAEQTRREQLAALRVLFFETLDRVAKGRQLWNERGWELEKPEWFLDPEDWAPVARVLWLTARLATIQREITERMYMGPGWCDECRGAEFPGRPWVRGLCMAHRADKHDAAIAQTLWEELGLTE